MAIRLNRANSYKTENVTELAKNSLDLTGGAFFLSSTSGVANKAAAGERVIGVNLTEKAYASDNESSALARVTIVPSIAGRLYEVAIVGGTVTVADEFKFYNLTATAGDTVDGTTESVTESYVDTSDTGAAVDPVVKMQLQLVRFISATKGVFRIVL